MPKTTDQLKAFNRGEDRKSPGHLIPDGFLSRAQNVRFTSGVPVKINGFQRFLGGDGMPPDDGEVLFFAQHVLGAARLLLIVTNTNRCYTYDDATGTFTQRRRLPGTLGHHTWWVSSFGSTKIVGDGVNLPWRLETSGRVTPLPGRRLAGFESTETWTLPALGITDNGADTTEGLTAATSAFVEGTQGHRYTWAANTTAALINTTDGPWDIQTGPYATSPNFTTADPGAAQCHLRVFVNAGAGNFTGGHVQIGDNAGANYRRFYTPTTLASGENLLVMPFSASLTAGAAPTSASARFTVALTTSAVGTLDVTLDDAYVSYVNGGPVGADYGEVHKSILFQSGDTAVPFRVYFSNPNNPSYYTTTDSLDVFDKVSLDPRIEVRALKSFFDTLIVGTRNTVFGINGSNRDTFTISEQASGQGITDHRSLVPFGDTFLYRYKNRIYAYSVSNLQAVSLPVEPLLDVIDETVQSVSVRWIKRNALWFTYRDTSGTQRVLQWDYGSGQKAWSTLTIPARAVFPYVTTNGETELVTVNTDGVLYLQDMGAQFYDTDFSAVIETRWLGADTAPRVRKWLRAHLLFAAVPDTGVLVAWRTANHPAEFDSAAWSADVTLDQTSLAEGTFLDIGEYGRFFQLRVTQTESASLIYFTGSWISFDPHFKAPVGETGFVGEVFQTFQFDPPVNVRSYPLVRRT